MFPKNICNLHNKQKAYRHPRKHLLLKEWHCGSWVTKDTFIHKKEQESSHKVCFVNLISLKHLRVQRKRNWRDYFKDLDGRTERKIEEIEEVEETERWMETDERNTQHGQIDTDRQEEMDCKSKHRGGRQREGNGNDLGGGRELC